MQIKVFSFAALSRIVNNRICDKAKLILTGAMPDKKTGKSH